MLSDHSFFDGAIWIVNSGQRLASSCFPVPVKISDTMSKHITMADVAREAGVHQTTVSLALRNDTRIARATRERIQELARAMNYRPNPLVSALISERRKGRATGRGAVLAFLTSDQERGRWRLSSTYNYLFQRMVEHARARGYALEEFWLSEPGMTPGRMRRILLNRGIRGIVVCPLQQIRHSLEFDFSEFSAVALGYTLKSPALDHVSPDYCANMSLAIHQLIGRGFKRIVFFTSLLIDERVNHLSLACYLAERELNARKILAPVVFSKFSKALLAKKLADCRPDAVLISTSIERRAFSTWFGDKVLTASLDCYEQTSETGIVRSVDEEGEAAISFVANRVERAKFGLLDNPRSILIKGRWSW